MLFAKLAAPRAVLAATPSTSTEFAKTLALSRAATRNAVALSNRIEAGMCLALLLLAMLLSELAIIYLATAAPFGVSRFLDQNAQGARRLHTLFESAAAALAWPVTALMFLFKNAKARTNKAKMVDESVALDEGRIESVKRATVNAILAIEDLLLNACGLKGEADERHSLFAARASVERYAGLALACAELREDAAPSERELELCRITGRAGDDLLIAGRCVHRRNVTRLLAHRERVRAELVHALAGVGEVAHAVYSASRPFHSPEQTGSEPAKEISEALLRAFSRAIELLSLFDDRTAVVGVARLLDAECARLRRLEARDEAATPVRPNEGVGQCTTQAVHTAFATQHLPTTTSTGG
ncbi:MAG: hypothetical protein H7Z38_12100 [Rubrivivax sp.]|nr:hypothetical protein [Pyrinomonadaceae bacterium]